jgi:hypothetical protein
MRLKNFGGHVFDKGAPGSRAMVPFDSKHTMQVELHRSRLQPLLTSKSERGKTTTARSTKIIVGNKRDHRRRTAERMPTESDNVSPKGELG